MEKRRVQLTLKWLVEKALTSTQKLKPRLPSKNFMNQYSLGFPETQQNNKTSDCILCGC